MFGRKLAAALALCCALAVPQRALADRPEHLMLEFPDAVLVGPFAAGEVCDFAYQLTVSDEVVNVIRFYDDGVRVRVIFNDAYTVLHENLDTGAALEERVHAISHRDLVTREETLTGNFWHLRSVGDGDVVFTGSGRYVVNMDTGEVLEATPNSHPDFASTICAVLGDAD
jgi:hypothetical protein